MVFNQKRYKGHSQKTLKNSLLGDILWNLPETQKQFSSIPVVFVDSLVLYAARLSVAMLLPLRDKQVVYYAMKFLKYLRHSSA